MIRAKRNLRFYRKTSQAISRPACNAINHPVDRSEIRTALSRVLARVRLIDSENNQDIVLLTNITHCNAVQIADYYKSRRQIELFFKWIKQNLRIKAFYEQSINVVKTQIWMAIYTYLIMIILIKPINLTFVYTQ